MARPHSLGQQPAIVSNSGRGRTARPISSPPWRINPTCDCEQASTL